VFRKLFIFCIIAWGGFVVWQLAFSNDLFQSSGKVLNVKLTQGNFPAFVFPSQQRTTKAIIIFGSGDGGWSTFEEAIGHACQKQGYEMIGIDSEAYAKADYDLATLQANFSAIADAARVPFEKKIPPLIVGGYSMGAAQAAAVAGGPNPPKGLIGLVIVDMLARGRYGLRTSDQMNVLPSGDGTFGLEGFTQTMPQLRVVQWHAEEDSIDSLTWLNSLSARHEEFTFPGTGHGYNNKREEFIREFVKSIGWILEPNEDVPAKTASNHE
jgi:phosphatidylglycerol lysyltransferase